MPPWAKCWFLGERSPLAAILGVSGSSWRALLDALPRERLRCAACARVARLHELLAASTHDLACEMHIPVRVYGVLLAHSDCTVPPMVCKGTLAQRNITVDREAPTLSLCRGDGSELKNQQRSEPRHHASQSYSRENTLRVTRSGSLQVPTSNSQYQKQSRAGQLPPRRPHRAATHDGTPAPLGGRPAQAHYPRFSPAAAVAASTAAAFDPSTPPSAGACDGAL